MGHSSSKRGHPSLGVKDRGRCQTRFADVTSDALAVPRHTCPWCTFMSEAGSQVSSCRPLRGQTLRVNFRIFFWSCHSCNGINDSFLVNVKISKNSEASKGARGFIVIWPEHGPAPHPAPTYPTAPPPSSPSPLPALSSQCSLETPEKLDPSLHL